MQTSLAKADNYHPINSFAKEVMNVDPWWWKANPKGSGSLPAPRSDHATTDMVFFAHLLMLEDLDQHQDLISSSLYHHPPPPLLQTKRL